jgi:hypothetical protein
MNNKIEWKESKIDYNELNKLNNAKLNRIEGGKQTINQNRTKESCSKGGKKGGRITGDKIKNGEKIGFHAISMQERIEKHFSKPRPYRRLLSEKQKEYIQKVYYRPTNQFDKIPKGKKSIGYLMSKFDVSKTSILRCLRDEYKK